MQSSNTPGKLLHIWVARLELFMHYESFYKHEEMFNGLTRDNFYELGGKYNVHHINGNKFDNEVDNLIILPRTMHDAIHRTYTILGREIGIRALMDIKAKAPHIPELAD